MKRKILCLLIACSLALTISAGAFTDTLNTKYEEAANRLCALGIMRGYEDGSFKPERNVSRAEFSALITRALGYEDAAGMKAPFTDVPENHWAAEEIAIAEVLGIVNGVGNGLFSPDNEVTYEQAIKMIVTALGYNELAITKGGYPNGYITVASSKGILKKVGRADNTPATRGDIVLLLNEAIDVDIADSEDGVGGEDKVILNENLYENLMDRKDMMLYLGVVTANEFAKLNGYTIADEDTVKIGNKIFKNGETNISDMLGHYVKIYASGESEAIPEIVKFEEVDAKNKIIDIKAEDIETLSSSEVKYRNDGKLKSAKIKNTGASFIYNSKDVDPNVTPINELMPYNGAIKLISYDGASEYSTVLIEDVHSFVIDKVNDKNKTIYFEKGILFNGRSGFKFNLEDEDFIYKMVDDENNPIQFSEFRKGMVVSLKSSLDLKINEAILSDEAILGKVTSISQDDGIIEIDGIGYHLAENKTGFPYFPELMTEANFLIDVYGNIVGDSGEIETAEKYAFVFGYGKKNLGDVEIYLIYPGSATKNVTVKNDKEIISYMVNNGNGGIGEVFKLDGDMKVYDEDGNRCKLKDINLTNHLIKYRKKDTGEISKIIYFPAVSEEKDYGLNTKLFSFGGSSGYEGFIANENTKFVLVPQSYVDEGNRDESNFTVEVKLEECEITSSPIRAYAAEVDPITQIAEAVVIIKLMKADEEVLIVSEDTAMSIVGKVTNVLGENGEWLHKVTMLTGDKLTETYCAEYDLLANKVSNLRMGDLIQYHETSQGKIDGLIEYGNVRALGDSFFKEEDGQIKYVYGVVESAKIDFLSSYDNEMADRLVIDCGDYGVEDMTIFREDAPTVYRYERSTGNIYSATTDEIIDRQTVGDNATKVYVVSTVGTSDENKTHVIVLIED